jgi:MFS family permease
MLWFCGGLGMALITILAGLSAGKDERGKIFGIVSITGGLGALIGGLATGYIVDHWGFPTMFSVVALFLILWPLSVLFLTDKKIARTQQKDRQPKETPGLGKNYSLLFTASLLSNSASFFIILGRSLVMGKLEFGAAEIASTGAVGGGVGMLLPLLMGWLSDRTERKIFLYLGNLAGIISLSILAFSTSLWHFWIVIVIQSIFISTNATIGNALVTDLAHPTALAKGLSLFSATGWIGGVIGFAGAGTAFQALGVLPTFFLGVGLILAAIGLLIPIRKA